MFYGVWWVYVSDGRWLAQAVELLHECVGQACSVSSGWLLVNTDYVLYTKCNHGFAIIVSFLMLPWHEYLWFKSKTYLRLQYRYWSVPNRPYTLLHDITNVFAWCPVRLCHLLPCGHFSWVRKHTKILETNWHESIGQSNECLLGLMGEQCCIKPLLWKAVIRWGSACSQCFAVAIYTTASVTSV